MKTKKSQQVTIGYPLGEDWITLQNKIDFVVEKFNGSFDGSGGGFGYRDLDRTFPDRESALRCEKELKKLKIKDLVFTFY